MTHRHLPLTPEWLLWPEPWVWALLLIPIVLPLLWLAARSPSRRAVVRFPNVAAVRLAGGAWRGRLRIVLPLLRAAALVCLLVAVARPQRADESSVIYAEGVAIQFALDISGSMVAPDLDPSGRRSRLDVAKDMFMRFVLGDGKELPGRPNDLVGVITFARFPDHICPLTLDRDALKKLTRDVVTIQGLYDRAEQELSAAAQRVYPQNPNALLSELNRRGLLQVGPDAGGVNKIAADLKTQPADIRNVITAFNNRQQIASEDGTAVGDGLALAVERLRDLRRATGSSTELKIKSKVIILLTDGENNAGNVTPKQAAELAATSGIKVYTVLVGTDLGGRAAAQNAKAAADLKEIAEISGGRSYRALNADSLARIYAEIDQLERTRVEERSFVHLADLARPWLLIAFVCVCVQSLLDATWLRKLA